MFASIMGLLPGHGNKALSLVSRLEALRAERSAINKVAEQVSTGIDNAILDLFALKTIVTSVQKETN